MHIVFLAPCAFKLPCGGRKVILDYINRFIKDGHDVTILYPNYTGIPNSISKRKYKFKEILFLILKYLYYRITNNYTPHHWYNLNKKVVQKYVWSLSESNAPKADCYIATGIYTSFYLNCYNIPSTKKFYFIQGFEDWEIGSSPEMVIETFHFDLNKIVISSWLQKIIEGEGLKCIKAPNGFNFNEFKYSIDIADRKRYAIAIMYSENPVKGVSYSLEAIDIVKELYPQMEVNMFGICPKPDSLPEYFTYYQNPSKKMLNHIYNNSAIYLTSSINEGWGLTVGEAMMCGCAVVCSDTKGFLEMATNGYNALVVPTKNPQAAAKAIIELFEDNKLRCQLAENAIESIRLFDIENSYNIFKTEIFKNV